MLLHHVFMWQFVCYSMVLYLAGICYNNFRSPNSLPALSYSLLWQVPAPGTSTLSTKFGGTGASTADTVYYFQYAFMFYKYMYVPYTSFCLCS